MKKFYVYLMSVALLSAFVTGCGNKAQETMEITAETSEETDEGEELADEEEFVGDEEEFAGEYGIYADGAEWGNNYEGSAVYLDGKTAVVTITVNTEEEPWEEKEQKDIKKKVETALDFIRDGVKSYKKKAEFAFDEKDLNFEYLYDGSAEDFEYDDYETILQEFIEENLDTKKIREKYKADGIAYVFLLNCTGDSFADSHWQEDETEYFNELAFLYRTGYDENYEEVENGPAVFAHQILRLFGAVELIEPDATYGYTSNLYNVVRENYKDDIMFTVFDTDGSVNEKKVTQKITDITAYALGLTEDFTELSDNDSFAKDYRACFTDKYMLCTNNGEDLSDYEWDDLYDESDDEADEDFIDDDTWEEDEEFTDDDDTWDDEDWFEDDENWDDDSWSDEDDADWYED